MWFLYAMLTWLFWGAANLYYKKGSNPEDKNSHAKITIMVGIVMGIHATIYMLVKGLDFRLEDMITYLPVSALYISSMVFGYVALRYLQLSIVAPLQNSSGAITVILLYIFYPSDNSWVHYAATAVILIGIILIAVLEKKEDDRVLLQAGTKIDNKYKYGFLALVFPLLYALLDGLGTFADSVVLDKKALLAEDAALLAYEYTFFTVAVVYWLYLKFIKKETMNIFKQKDRTIAALLETAGQFFYVYAIAAYSIGAAPIIASYCVFSILLGRIFLKEKLSKPQYAVITLIVLGIILLGVADEL